MAQFTPLTISRGAGYPAWVNKKGMDLRTQGLRNMQVIFLICV